MSKPGDYIETKAGECDEVIGPEGNRIKLGLLPPTPASGPQVFASLSSAIPLLSKDEAKAIITSQFRKPARQIWGPAYIKNQGVRGACQGYASAAAVERTRDLNGQDFISLSGDFAYSLVNGGRDRGSQLSDGFRAAKEIGYCPEDTPGLVRWEYRKSRMPQAAFEAAKNYKGFEGFVAQTEQELVSGMAHGGIAVVATHVTNSFSRLDRYGVSGGRGGPGNHAECCDDIVWDDELGEFKYDLANSWNTTWGDSGRHYCTFERHFSTTIRVHKFYVFFEASVDPQGNNPPPLRIV
jgi:hypothetical protein